MNSIYDLITNLIEKKQIDVIETVRPSGLKDWAKILNNENKKITDDKVKAVISNCLLYISSDNRNKATELFVQLLVHYDAIDLMEDIVNAVSQYNNDISKDDIYEYVFEILEDSDNGELIKIALILAENILIIRQQDRIVIENLAYCSEFSYFCFRIISNWNNGNEKIFEIGQKLKQWGKTAAVYALDYNSDEILQWINISAIRDPLMLPSYVIHLYYCLNIFDELNGEVETWRLYDICYMISNMLNNRICRIDEIKENEEFVLRFLKQCEGRNLDIIVYETMYDIYDFYEGKNKEITEKCHQLMHQRNVVEKAKAAANRYGFYNIANELGVVNNDSIIELLVSNFNNNFSALNNINSVSHCEEIINIYKDNIDFSDINKYYRSDTVNRNNSLVTTQIMTLLNYLGKCTGKGLDIVENALKCKIIDIRFFAAKVLMNWCFDTDHELDEINAELIPFLNEMLAKEKNPDIRELLIALCEGNVLQKYENTQKKIKGLA